MKLLVENLGPSLGFGGGQLGPARGTRLLLGAQFGNHWSNGLRTR
jgi:hypothetical protein